MAENRNNSQDQSVELEKLRREAAEQSAELEQLRREKAEAEQAARRAEAEYKALSDKIDADVTRMERDNIRQLHAQRKARLKLPSGRSAHERAPVLLGVNGQEFMILRDQEVIVPEAVLNVLNLARERVPVSSEVNGQQVVTWEETPRFPVQMLGYVEAETAMEN